MKVVRLSLRQFRNVEEASFEPHPRLNFLVGQNGQGKTSFLEALGYLATLRSFRGAKTDEVVRWNQPGAEIHCVVAPDQFESGDWNTDLKLVFSTEGQRTSKTAFINGKPFRSSTQYLSQRFGSVELGFHTIVFNPADHDLVRGEPSIRRGYLDRVIAAEDIDYLKSLTKYQRLLEQRNALLKSEPPPARSLVQGFTEPLAKLAAWITLKRLEWLLRLSKHLDPIASQIAPGGPELKAFYMSNWSPEIPGLSILNNHLSDHHFTGLPLLPSLELLEQSFWIKQSSLAEAELRSRSSLVGPHRDDWGFVMAQQQKSTNKEQRLVLKGHGSQGEVRSALLALKLSEIELFRKTTGHRPLLLLDDFSSELDRQRRSFLLQYLAESDLQVFVTTTEASEDMLAMENHFPIFHVENGKIKCRDRKVHQAHQAQP